MDEVADSCCKLANADEELRALHVISQWAGGRCLQVLPSPSRADGESDIATIHLGELTLPAFLVTTTILVEAKDEIQASHKALRAILAEPSVTFDVKLDDEHVARIIIDGNQRRELIERVGLVEPANETL